MSKRYDKITETTLAVVLGIWILTYFIFIDKSVYHIDDVSKPFILFLYFSSMLVGALFKKHIDKFGKIKIVNIVLLFVSLIVYFGSKIAFSTIQFIVFWQIFNQLSILVVLYFMFAVFIGLEDCFKKIPNWINKAVKFVAGITLHIYLVQFVVIRAFESLIFPLNFLVTTVMILAAASALYFAEYFMRKGIYILSRRQKEKKNNAESND